MVRSPSVQAKEKPLQDPTDLGRYSVAIRVSELQQSACHCISELLGCYGYHQISVITLEVANFETYKVRAIQIFKKERFLCLRSMPYRYSKKKGFCV